MPEGGEVHQPTTAPAGETVMGAPNTEITHVGLHVETENMTGDPKCRLKSSLVSLFLQLLWVTTLALRPKVTGAPLPLHLLKPKETQETQGTLSRLQQTGTASTRLTSRPWR